MKNLIQIFCLFFLTASALYAQVPEDVIIISSEESEDEQTVDEDTSAIQYEEEAYINGIVKRTLPDERRILPYERVREADVPWEKMIWRVVDRREKINLPFGYPPQPLINILIDGVKEGEILPFNSDQFDQPMSKEDVNEYLFNVDTQETIDPVTYEVEIKVVRNDLNPGDIKKYRIKEVWYFDEEASRLAVRILGIAPILDVYGEDGTFLYPLPMFWVYFPEARDYLSKHYVVNGWNDVAPMSWAELFDTRHFASYIVKETNIMDMRLKDYENFNEIDQLLESENIKEKLFNFEHDLWSY